MKFLLSNKGERRVVACPDEVCRRQSEFLATILDERTPRSQLQQFLQDHSDLAPLHVRRALLRELHPLPDGPPPSREEAAAAVERLRGRLREERQRGGLDALWQRLGAELPRVYDPEQPFVLPWASDAVLEPAVELMALDLQGMERLPAAVRAGGPGCTLEEAAARVDEGLASWLARHGDSSGDDHMALTKLATKLGAPQLETVMGCVLAECLRRGNRRLAEAAAVPSRFRASVDARLQALQSES